MELDHEGLITDLLEKAATHIKALMKVEADLRGACMSMAMEMTK